MVRDSGKVSSALFLLVFGAVLAACSGGASPSGAPSGAAAAAAPAGRAPRTWEVQMTNANGMVTFEPKELTIQDGDTVKWVIAGGSHNVVFWPDSVPSGAVPMLRAAMPDTAGPLQSPRFPNVGDSYSVVFKGMPKGTYKYYCRPHLMRGMVGALTIQ